ncbi:penicillin-binding protein activator [Legionella worsleiensis]|uniref:Lipoprotein n=1 Tax=Legionella worsleiensis TaxID=45076 RepID=A0A0W1AEI1_9GAMM|nr:penicillin-binding protein activator [Legionella worsleiensis]KTD79688.1 lipoprotein [Legionella worsleiensis]STY32199.1 Lipoprotein [Legionella worsleiensis]
MFLKLSDVRIVLVLAASFLICHCTKTVNSTEPVATVQKKVVNPYSMPTATYLALAKKEEGHKKNDLLLAAAGRMISEGQWRKGLAILAQSDELTEEQLNEKNVLLAKIDVIRDKPEAALTQLAKINQSQTLSSYNQIQYHELRAQSYRLTGHLIESVQERITLETLLSGTDLQTNNLRTLWLTLINIPQTQLSTMVAEAVDKSELQGWLQLAVIAGQYRESPKSLLDALAQWQSHFTNHPANALLPSPLNRIADKMIAKPKHIALLLPMSGPLSGPGKAVHDGFMAAYKSRNDEETTQIKFYDTAKGDVTLLYQKAIDAGADYVVGPLTKSQVAAVAALNHPVPTLLLNDSATAVQDNSYLFGLSPANEATQVALKAQSKGYRKALVIAPKNDWGNEVTKAFSQQWTNNGGKIADTLLYGAEDDLNKNIQDFLKVSESQAREKRLKQVLGTNLNALTTRRHDFDMIFLLAYPTKARQIMPLLKYYYAGDVPVFATSTVYGGSANALKDKDLDGVVFCDIPWVFSHQAGSRNWPEQFNSYNRLYALGMDSYALATQLNQLILFPADGAMEANGTLFLQPSGQVARVLEWGQFRQGLVQSLGTTV